MPSLTLQFEDRVLNDWVVGLITTIGRLPDNTVVIDNPSVSSHHACVFRDGDRFVLEDFQSTNGTFVNGKRVTRHTLQNGDVVIVGKHKLLFDQATGGAPDVPDEEQPMMSNLGDTVFLDTTKYRALLANLTGLDDQRPVAAAASASANTPNPSAQVATLRVLAGRADQPEYNLQARTCLIGSSHTALVRLHGWFKPTVAVAIARSADGWVATLLRGKTLINSRPLAGRYDLKDGDVLRVCGLTLQFSMKGS